MENPPLCVAFRRGARKRSQDHCCSAFIRLSPPFVHIRWKTGHIFIHEFNFKMREAPNMPVFCLLDEIAEAIGESNTAHKSVSRGVLIGRECLQQP